MKIFSKVTDETKAGIKQLSLDLINKNKFVIYTVNKNTTLNESF